MKIDPSSTQPDYAAMDAAPASDGGKPAARPTKTVYPDLTLRGDAADTIIAQHQAGETFDADVTFKVTAIHARKGGTANSYGPGDNESSVELEIINIEKEDETEPPEPDEEDAGSAIDSFRASKAAPPEED